MEYLANILTNKLVKMQIIKEEDKELYVYGFWQGVIIIFNFATVVIVGLLFHMLWQSLVFMASYGLLRPVSGGYHSRTQQNCYILSIVLIITVLCAIKWLPWSIWTSLIILLASIYLVFLLAPVEDENKPLDELEQRVYKKRSRIVVSALTLLAVLFIVVEQLQIANCIIISILAVAIMLILGKIKNINFRD